MGSAPRLAGSLQLSASVAHSSRARIGKIGLFGMVGLLGMLLGPMFQHSAAPTGIFHRANDTEGFYNKKERK
jgi:hypothetical protein